MQPFENLHSESKSAPIRTRDVTTGRFVAGVGDYGNGMSAEIVSTEEEVSKADKKDTTSAAALGAGLAAGSVSVAHNRVGNTINAANRKFYNARADKVSQAYGLNDKGKAVSDPRATMPKDSAGRTKYSSPEERKSTRAQASAYVKNKHRKVHALKTKAASTPVSGSGRSKILLGGASAGVPLIWAGSRGLTENQSKKVSKAFPKEGRDVDVGMLGAAAGAGGYQAAGYALKPLDRRAEAKIKSDPKLQARQKAYQKASGRPKNAKAGDPAWKNYFRNYPKDLPGGKLKRTLSRTHTGKSGVALTTAAGLAGAGGAIQARQQWNKKKIAKALKEKKDYSGNVVGAGAAATGAGLVGGGVPGARPDSGRLNQARGSKGTRTEKTRHLVSATRGGVFGYRQDAHQRFLNDQNSRLKNWKPHSRENAFERGRESGKTIPEMKIIRHMKNARTASNVLAVGGAGAVGAGLIARQRNKSKVSKAKDDYKFRSDAMMTAGATTAAGSAIGAQALNAQGRKWAKDSAENLDAAQKKNPAAGGYTVKKPKRGGVPDVKPTRTSNDIMYSGSKETFAGKPRREAHRLGAMRGKAAQGRYFARVYGNSAKALNRYGIGGGLALVGAGAHHKKYKTTRRDDVEKSMPDASESHVMGNLKMVPKKASSKDKKKKDIKPVSRKEAVATSAAWGLGGAGMGAYHASSLMRDFKGPIYPKAPRNRAIAGGLLGGTLAGASAYGIGQQAKKAGVVTKSWIPGKGWVPAAQAGKSALRAAKGSGAHRDMRQTSMADEEARIGITALRDLADSSKADPGVKKLSTKTNRHGSKIERFQISPESMKADFPGASAFAASTGGRRGNRQIYTTAQSSKSDVAHEMAHTAPKRSSYRMTQIIKDPKKLAREEARADMAGGSRYRKDAGRANSAMAREMKSPGKSPVSGYSVAAGNKKYRETMHDNTRRQEFLTGNERHKMFSRENMGEYRKVQDNIDRSQGRRLAPYQARAAGNKIMEEKGLIGATAAATGGGAVLGDMQYKRSREKYGTQGNKVTKALFNKPTLHRLEPSKAKRPPSIKPPKPKNNVPTMKPPTVQRTKRAMAPKPTVKQTGIGTSINR